MKKLPQFLLLIGCIFTNTIPSFAQWIQTTGPTSSNIKCFAQSGSNLYAGTYQDGVFLSTNNGTTWKAINNGIGSFNDIFSIAVSGSNLFVLGYYYDGNYALIFSSTDNGANWTRVDNNFESNHIMTLVTMGTNLFAGTDQRGVFLSANNGATWTNVNNGLNTKRIRYLTVSDTNIYAATYNGGGIYISTDKGVSWQILNSPTGGYDWSGSDFIKLSVSGNNILAFEGDGVIYSSDGGISWENITPNGNTQSNSAAFSPNGSGGINLIVGTSNLYPNQTGIYFSADSGKSWSQKNTGLLNLEVNALFVSSNGVGNSNIFAGTEGGVFISTNNGTNWAQRNTGLTHQYINVLAANGTNLYAGAGNGGLFLSTNSGTNWTQINDNSFLFPITAISITNDNKIFIGTDGGGGFCSTDNGTSWKPLWNTMSMSSSVLSLANNSNGTGGSNIFAGGGSYDGIKLSTDNGDSWNTVNNGLDTTSTFYSIVVKDNKIYASNNKYGVYFSINNGTNWAKIDSGLISTSIWCLAVNNSYLFAGTSNAGVFLSSNDGTNWTAINNGLTYKTISSFAVRNDTLFAGTYDGGVFSSINDGTTWTQFNNGLMNDSINTLVISGSNIYVGTVAGGVWKRPLSDNEVSVPQEKNEVPRQFVLSQNYPNPFNPSTTISFSLPSKSFVSLKVFDMLGREVTTIVSEEMSAGNYSRQLNATTMSSGVYFYRLQAGSFNETKKLVLLR